jgi:CubicO group peptidase (beta-lactamase class C family)
MKTNSIFWIASMSKPVTSVAAMILVDDGKLDLDAPVARYLPELQDMRVAVEKTDPATGKTEHGLDLPKRPMTVRDLLRHTSGIVYPELDFAFPERGLADAASEAGIRYVHMLYSRTDSTAYRRDTTLADFVSALARLPLAHQPGEVWEYGLSADVLGRVVEVASGEPLTDSCRAASSRRCIWSTPASMCRKRSSAASSILRCRSGRGSGMLRSRRNCFPAGAASYRPRPTISAFARCF